MGYKLVDIIDQKFNRWSVIGRAHNRGSKAFWLCECECGNKREVSGDALRNNRSLSCGCLQREVAAKEKLDHGFWNHKFYPTWNGMVARCYNGESTSFNNYGGRGIKVCEEWRHDPTVFCEWCDNQDIPKGYTLDRINNDGNYEPSNCRFASKKEQQHNTRRKHA